MAADDPERRAGRIEQNAIERHPVPPVSGRTRIAVHDLGVQPAALEVLAHPREALAIDVDRDETSEPGLALGHERGLSPGRRAGIEHPLTRLEAQRKGDALRAEILHRNHALGKPRQLVDVARRLPAARPAARAARGDASMPASRSLAT